MYTTFFGLAEAPFNITPDPRFVYLSSRHAEALTALKYGVHERKGFILLTGEIGSGKTTICRKLVHDLQQENVRTALILNPGLSELELLKAINDEFGIPSYHNTKKGLLDQLNEFLLDENRKGTNVVLIIDESQTLEPTLLEQIRMLSNLETENDKLVQIILIGQPELNETLALPQLEQLNQRIIVRFHITPLSYDEMKQYIQYRLQVAKAKIDIRFTEDALKKMYEVSGGVPRKINIISDRSLLGCYAASSYVVDGDIISRAIKEVGVEPPNRNKPKNKGFIRQTGTALTHHAAVAFSPKTVIILGVLLFGIITVSFAVGTAIYMANIKGKLESAKTDKRLAEDQSVPMNPNQLVWNTPDETSDTSETSGEKKAKPTPVSTPVLSPEEYKTMLTGNPNWIYESRDIPLVRVNNPNLTLLACKLSMLRMWGRQVNMDAMSKIPDLEKNAEIELKNGLQYISIPGDINTVIQYNLPVIVRLKLTDKDKASLRSEYVVLLKADGLQIVIGDPLWGISTTTKNDLMDKWNGATAMFVDEEDLGSIRRGDRNERVKALQIFLRDQHGLPASKVTGVFDMDTVEAIAKLQLFYKLKDSGNLDPLTLMIINSRIMREGPKLNNATGW